MERKSHPKTTHNKRKEKKQTVIKQTSKGITFTSHGESGERHSRPGLRYMHVVCRPYGAPSLPSPPAAPGTHQ